MTLSPRRADRHDDHSPSLSARTRSVGGLRRRVRQPVSSLAQRRGFRDYLQGLLLPRDRNKTLTGLAGAEPIAGAQHREVQRLQWFLSESAWDHQVVNDQRVRLLCEDPATAPHGQGALVIDAALVNLCEAGLVGNHCVVAVSSCGWLIHTAVGSAGGVGGLRTKRSGWAA
jgi:hypothetical protein